MSETSQRHRPDTHKNLVGFVVGEVHYAIDISRVREIVNPLLVTALPHMPSDVAGVADHRGEVVPVINLRVRFNLEPKPEARGTKWILITLSNRVVGLIVDSVTEVSARATTTSAPRRRWAATGISGASAASRGTRASSPSCSTPRASSTSSRRSRPGGHLGDAWQR